MTINNYAYWSLVISKCMLKHKVGFYVYVKIIIQKLELFSQRASSRGKNTRPSEPMKPHDMSVT